MSPRAPSSPAARGQGGRDVSAERNAGVDELAVAGLGLIGGSLARDARACGFARRLLGVEPNPAHARRALELGLVDEVLPLDRAVGRAALTVVAVPVDAALEVLPAVLDRIGGGQVVTDVCSTKRVLMDRVRQHPRRARYVGGHPMAGTENSGPDAALAGLFAGKAGILCDVQESAPDAVAAVEALYRALGLRIEHLDAARHDQDVAYVSHVSHVIAYALALTVLEKERDEQQLLNLASGGFSSTARLAKSSAAMWAPIFATNRDNVLAVIDTYLGKLDKFRRAIEAGDEAGLRALITAANAIRQVLRE